MLFIECKSCGKTLEVSSRSKRKYCSKECRTKAFAEAVYWMRGSTSLSTGTVGAISELRVCTDLLQKGFEVFRAVSQACSCDLAILKDGKLLRVEVRTGYENPETGKFYTNKQPKDLGRYDVFAAVLPTRIVYDPPLEN